MKVLQITHKPHFPLIDGGCIAMATIVNGLLEANIEVKICSLSTQKHPFSLDNYPENWKQKVKPENVFIDTSIKFAKAFANLFSSDSYFISRFKSKEFESLILKILEHETFDIIQLESVFLLPYYSFIRQNTTAKIIYRSHNLEHQLWEERSNQKSFIKKLYLSSQARRLKKEEIELAKLADGIVCISQREVDFFKQHTDSNKIIYLPTGKAVKQVDFQNKTSFFHLGAMDWQPNIDGINWFLKNVWKTSIDEKIQLHLGGKQCSNCIKSTLKNVTVHGKVADAGEFMLQNGIMLVPLFSGSGLRIKIIEAGALGIPIIATSKAVEGIGLTKDKDYLEANTASEFTEKMMLLIENTDLQKQLSLSIQEFIAVNYNPQKLTKQLIEFYQHIS